LYGALSSYHGGCADQHSKHGPERKTSFDCPQPSLGEEGVKRCSSIADHSCLQETSAEEGRKEQKKESVKP